jgi:hypothetical protein
LVELGEAAVDGWIGTDLEGRLAGGEADEAGAMEDLEALGMNGLEAPSCPALGGGAAAGGGWRWCPLGSAA